MNKGILTEAEALQKMAAYCARGEHCTGDVEDKLKCLGLSTAAIGRIVEKLKKESFIDDARYCRAFINDHLLFSGWGRLKLAQALYQKHIDREIYQSCIDAIDVEVYRKALRRVLQCKAESLDEQDEYQRKMKLVRYAVSRGFMYEEVMEMVE